MGVRCDPTRLAVEEAAADRTSSSSFASSASGLAHHLIQNVHANHPDVVRFGSGGGSGRPDFVCLFCCLGFCRTPRARRPRIPGPDRPGGRSRGLLLGFGHRPGNNDHDGRPGSGPSAPGARRRGPCGRCFDLEGLIHVGVGHAALEGDDLLKLDEGVPAWGLPRAHFFLSPDVDGCIEWLDGSRTDGGGGGCSAIDRWADW